MIRFLLPVLLLSLGGCATKAQFDELDARVKAIEEKSAKPEASQALKAPGAAAAAAAANDPNEVAAGTLMKEAQQAINNADFPTAKAKLAEIAEKYPETRAAKAAARINTEVALIGSPAPKMEVEKWYQGKADFSASKASLLIFWEQWCPHCKEEMPKMQPLSEKWKDKLNVVGVTKVTRKATDELVMAFLKENNILFPIGKETGTLSTAFAVTGIPAAAMVSNGNIIWRGHPNKLTDDFLTKMLK
jgi:thiol-disulfide isomerase/thioredoxin